MSFHRILVIDDDAGIGRTVQAILAPRFKNVSFCTSSSQAFDILMKENFDLLICDIHMPEADGASLIKALRENGVMAPVIFLTGDASRDVYKTCLRLGAADVLEKGVETRLILQTVLRTLEIETRKIQYYSDKALKRASELELEMQQVFLGRLQTSQIKVY